MKVLHIVLSLLFFSFALVQYNDPDPFLWILIYGVMTAFCLQAARGKFYPRLMWAAALGFGIYAVILAPGTWDWWNSDDRSLLFDDLAKMQFYYIEEAREFLGLMICLVVIGIYSALTPRKTA